MKNEKSCGKGSKTSNVERWKQANRRKFHNLLTHETQRNVLVPLRKFPFLLSHQITANDLRFLFTLLQCWVG
ncbi:CLUMA_CG017767, isoform A [Clunio marinus]|uniref:CLUMA_CG017767, isoform A n=1 Tax=Clunio marinus TaxID=568069 RepID=A0A1J1IX73_9DIPT|nr:CLUMA_CG017767, isoform A [Clunio marinus]